MKEHDVGAYIPQLRPHNQRRGQNVFFMISSRPLLVLTDEDTLLYDSIDGCKTVAELEQTHPGAGDRLVKWQEAAIIELIPPVAAPAAPHLVVIEPHMDDAILSTGGRLLNRRGRCRITILSVVKASNFTSYLFLNRAFLNVHEVTKLRQQESALVARLLGAEHRCLDWADAPLRNWPAERWSLATVEKYKKANQHFVKGFPTSKDVSLLAEQLTRELSLLAPDELWIPMGLGDHLDHRTTRSACLLMLEARSRFSHVPVSIYEEVPYAAEPGHVAQIRTALASCGTRLVRATEDVSDVFEEKIRLSSIYASQFKISYIEPVLRGFAEREGGTAGLLAEAYHRVEGEPHLPLESHLSRDSIGLAALGAELRLLVRKRTKCPRLAVMALPSSHLGNWKDDCEFLAAAFPNTDLRVYASDDVAWQAEEGGNEKVSLEIVHGWGGWARVIWRELFRFRTPTVVMWRGAYSATPPMRMLKKIINIFIRLILPFRQLMFARRLSDFCGVLDEQSRQ